MARIRYADNLESIAVGGDHIRQAKFTAKQTNRVVEVIDNFTNSPEKHEEIRKFARSIIEKNTENWIDEWHQIDDFHDVHISNSEEVESKIEVWVYAVVKDAEGFDTTDTSRGYEVIL